MIVKQYTVTLPADYDVQIIRERVASKAPAFDDFPGLGVKVFMIRQKDRFGRRAINMHRSISGHRSKRCGNSLRVTALEASSILSVGRRSITGLALHTPAGRTSIGELCEASRVNRP